MMVILYGDENFKGQKTKLEYSRSVLTSPGVGGGPISLTMGRNDAVLLFRNQHYRGGVYYLRGAHRIEHLGRARMGGRHAWGQAASSAAIEAFTLKLNIIVVLNVQGASPGMFTSEADARTKIDRVVRESNRFLSRQRAFLKLEIAQISYVRDQNQFDLKWRKAVRFPSSWKRKGEIDVVFVNSMWGPGKGQAKFPWWGKTAVVNANRASVDALSRTFVHEIGHYLSLKHETDAANIMTQATNSRVSMLADSRLEPSQIEEMHQRLARNLTRMADRHDP